MPFESTLSPYVTNNSCYTPTSPALVSNGGGPVDHRTTEDGGEDSQNDLDVDDNSNNDSRLDEDQEKFLILSRNFYQEGNCAPALPYSAFNTGKLFNPYQGRLSMSPFSSHFEEESPRSAKSPSFETSHYIDYRDDKLKDVTCEEQEQKLFIPGDEASDVFVQKPIYPWMVDSRHNTKNRQQQVCEGEKETFNQYLGKKYLKKIEL